MVASGAGPFDEVAVAVVRAALLPSAWHEAIDAMGRASGGLRVALIRSQGAGDAPEVSTSGYDPAYVASYERHYRHINPWAERWRHVAAGRIVRSGALMTREELTRTEFHADWARPQGNLVGGVGLLLASAHGQALMLGTDVAARHQERDECAFADLLGRLRPLLVAAMEVGRAVRSRDLDLLASAGGAPPAAAVLLVARDRRVLDVNRAAAALLEATDAPLRIDPCGRLRLADPRAEASLCRCLQARRASGGSAGAVAGPGGPRAVRMVPLDAETAARVSRDWFGSRSDAAALVVVEAPPAAAAPASRLRRLYGLTPAEAEVALLVHRGLTPDEIADARAVSVTTVRSQIKAGLAKTGARRQAELVRLVGRAADPG